MTTHYLLYRSLGHPACFIKASLLKNNAYREDFRIISDWFRQGKVFCHVPVVIADFDTTGISSQNTKLHQKEKEILYKDLFGEDNRQWIDESIAMQQMKEKYDNEDVKRIMQIRNRGGRRLLFLRKILNIFEK